MTIGQRMFQLLDESKREQKELALYIGAPTNTVSNWRTRPSDPPAKFLIPICEFFGVSIEYLLFGDANEKKTSNVMPNDLKYVVDKWNYLDEEWKKIVIGKVSEGYKEAMSACTTNTAKSR